MTIPTKRSALMMIGISKRPIWTGSPKDGVHFTNSFVGNSLCVPSRATLQTGKHSHNNTVSKIGDTFDGSQETFPKLLQGPATRRLLSVSGI